MRLYSALLHLFPAGFRNEYAGEMKAVFARKQRDAGGLLTVWLWIETLCDILWNAALVHLDVLKQDLRYTVRSLGRSPGFAATAVAVAAVGIGATTAAFAMLDHVILKPLPFADQDRLIELFEDHSAVSHTGQEWDLAPANYRDWKRMNTSFEAMASYRNESVNMLGEGEPLRLVGSAISWDMLPMLGVKPIVGRWFTESEDQAGAAGTAVLSYALWQNRFGGEANVVGRKILLDNEAFTVIGVMPKDFYFPTRVPQIWTPQRFAPSDYVDRNDNYIYGLGKLKPGVSLATARAEMRTIAAQLAHEYPKELAHTSATLKSLRDDIGLQTRLMIEALLGAAACVLLVASMNLANLLLARALERGRELAVRTAIGAGRERIIRQMLTESLVLSLTGGVLGIALAAAALPLMVKLVPVSLPIAEIPPVDVRFLLFALGITTLTGVGFGLVPALRACRAAAADNLREGARSGGGRRETLRSALVLAEIAGSVVLLVCCALLTRALGRVETIDPGFRTAGVLTARMMLPMPKYENVAARDRFYRDVLTKTAALPGVESAAFTSFLPMTNLGGVWPVIIPGQAAQDRSSLRNASLRFVSPGFFRTLGVPLLSGRDVEASDSPTSQFVAVVSDSFVKYYWPNQDPLGRTFNFGNHDRIVVGVAGDVRVRGLERLSEPQVYLPYTQHHDQVAMFYAPKDLAIRASGNLTNLVPALRQIVHEADPAQPISDIRTLADIVDAETLPRRVQAIALASFAFIAFLLAAIGIHGLLSFGVTSRIREIAVRIALGASPRNLAGTILGEAARLAIVGVAIGCLLAYAAAMQMRALLAGVTPNDWFSYSAAGALCLLMAVAGSLIPAVRAIRVDPAIAIRTE
ncbi:MAG TPA: ABC transporter permease [Bryobacteraceae bacterium]|jgi:predicted permease